MTQNLTPFTRFVKPALDNSSHLDNFIVRRDLQKLRHGVLPAGIVYLLKYLGPFAPLRAGRLDFATNAFCSYPQPLGVTLTKDYEPAINLVPCTEIINEYPIIIYEDKDSFHSNINLGMYK